MADEKIDANPESTWGASEEYKAAWHEQHGDVPPSRSASKSEWVQYATQHGMSEDDAENSTRDSLAEQFGGGSTTTAAPQTGAATGSSGTAKTAGTGNGGAATTG